MDAKQYWQLFLDTGAPELYILYNQARRSEETHVLDNQGIGLKGNGLQ